MTGTRAGTAVGSGSAHGRRTLLLLLDQAMSSASNMAMTLTAAHMLVPEEFGRIAAYVMVVYIVVAIQRSAVGEPMLVLRAAGRHSASTDAAGASIAAALAVATAVGCAAVAVFLPRGSLLAVMGLAGVAVVYQDHTRYVAMSRGWPGTACASDGAWLVSQLLAFVCLRFGLLATTPVNIVVTWGVGAVLAILTAHVRLGVFRFGHLRPWREELRTYSLWGGAQIAVVNLISHGTIFFLAGIVGFAAVGGYRAMVTLLQPIGLMLAAMIPVLTPRFAAMRRSPAEFRSRLYTSTVGLTAGAVVASAPVVAVGVWLTTALFGADYVKYAGLLPVIAAASVLQAAGIPLGAGLRAVNAGREIFIGQFIGVTIGLITAVSLAPHVGIVSAALGMLVQSLAWLFASGLALRKALSPPAEATVQSPVDGTGHDRADATGGTGLEPGGLSLEGDACSSRS